MKKQDNFEEWIQKKVVGQTIKPAQSVWKEVANNLPKEQPKSVPKRRLNKVLSTFIILFLLIYSYQQLITKEDIVHNQGEILFKSACSNCYIKKEQIYILQAHLQFLRELTSNKEVSTSSIERLHYLDNFKIDIVKYGQFNAIQKVEIIAYLDEVIHELNDQVDPQLHRVNNLPEIYSGDSLFRIKSKGPVDSLLENGEIFHEKSPYKIKEDI